MPLEYLYQEESATGAEGDAGKETKESVMLVEADAAAATALARLSAHESVTYRDEEAGGTGATGDRPTAQQCRALLLKSVQEHGVGGWEAKVRGLLTWLVSTGKRGGRSSGPADVSSVPNIYLVPYNSPLGYQHEYPSSPYVSVESCTL